MISFEETCCLGRGTIGNAGFVAFTVAATSPVANLTGCGQNSGRPKIARPNVVDVVPGDAFLEAFFPWRCLPL